MMEMVKLKYMKANELSSPRVLKISPLKYLQINASICWFQSEFIKDSFSVNTDLIFIFKSF